MSEINLKQAACIAERYLNEFVRTSYNSPPDDKWVVLVESAVDCGEYWMFHYQSAMYLSAGKLSYLLAGNLPLKISKMGDVLGFGASFAG